MVRAILEGRKSQTRRAISAERWPGLYLPPVPGIPEVTGERIANTYRCPYGTVGDRLWVRETVKAEELPVNMEDGVRYLADGEFRRIENSIEAANKWMDLYHYGKRKGANVPGIHMPRWASRITLEITGVRVERLQAISEADAMAEGVRSKLINDPLFNPDAVEWHSPLGYCSTAKEAYKHLWNSINGPGSWDANPWVWVISFRRAD